MLKPLNGRVIVKPEEKSNMTASGIILPDAKEKPLMGQVVVGNNEVKEGDRVLFSKFGYDEVECEGATYYVVSSATLLAIL